MKKSVLLFLSGFLLVSVFSTIQAAEEQIVIDDLSPAQLRAEIEKIQYEVYRVFNAANSDDKLNIICRDYTPTGSHLKQEACEPQFVTDRRGQNAADAQRYIDELLTPDALQADVADQLQVLTESMNALSKDNQYFRELNTILRVLREQLKEITS